MQRIYETGSTDFPSVSKSHRYRYRSEWKSLLERGSALAGQTKRRNLNFGALGNTQFTNTANLNSGQMGMSKNLPLYPTNNNPNEMHGQNHSMLQGLNQVEETSSFAHSINMNENVKGRPMEGHSIQVPESSLPSLSYMTPAPAYIWQLQNAPPQVHQNQEFTPALATPFNSQENQLSTGVPLRTEVLEPEKAQITSGHEIYTEDFLKDFVDGIQDLAPAVEQAPPPAGSSNQNQSLPEYTDLLKFLEEDLDNSFDSAQKTSDLDHFCEWLDQTLEEKSKEQ